MAESWRSHPCDRGASKEKIARSLGVHPGTLSQWEQGTRSPTIGAGHFVRRETCEKKFSNSACPQPP
ncbi:MAG: helix-turn-helix domain-containing protein [Gammaproteobacteria bacterium]